MVSRSIKAIKPETIQRAFTATGILCPDPADLSLLNPKLRFIMETERVNGLQEVVQLTEDTHVS
jgi:hypothetical protein